ncbi:hypothetical protein QQ045_004072 [Rhodiola kirilowii]
MTRVVTRHTAPVDSLQFEGGARMKRKMPSELRGEQLKRKNMNKVVNESAAPLLNSLNSLKSSTSSKAAKDEAIQRCAAVNKRNEYTFLSVAELSLGKERLSGQTVVDMDRALRGLVSSKPPAFSSVTSNSSKWRGNLSLLNSVNLNPELIVPGRNTPLDLTLKTYIRIVTPSPVSWLHRCIMGSTYNGTIQFFKQIGDSPNQEVNLMTESASHSQVFKSKALYSWVYPQSSLPPSVIAAFALSAAEGVEMDFVRKRHSAWEDAFRCLYYMLRKNACNLFYVCTAQFVVMFTSSAGQGKAKISCNAFISKTTRGLRSLLKEHVRSITISSSICAFNSNVSLWYFSPMYIDRSLLTFLIGADVPMLYSPVMFQNASLHTPEIQCKELKTLDRTAFTPKGSNMKNGDVQEFSSSSACYSIEVKDMYLPVETDSKVVGDRLGLIGESVWRRKPHFHFFIKFKN